MLNTHIGYCIRCKDRREMLVTKLSYYKNGAPSESGTCPICKSKMTRILRKEERQARQTKTEIPNA